MTDDQPASPEYEELLAVKASRLEDLLKRKPGQKHYKRSLKAFLDADAKAQKALLQRVHGVSAGAEQSLP